jgi:arylsulfatase A-like enzyme
MAVATGESGSLPELGDGKFTPREALLLVAWFGLGGGFLELGALLMAKNVLHTVEYYKQPRFFPCTIPLANLAIMLVPGLLVATLNRLRPGLVPLRAALWVFATLMLAAPLLVLPVTGWTGLLMAAGLGRLISRLGVTHAALARRLIRVSLVGMAGMLVAITASTIALPAATEYWTNSHLPTPPSGASNVLLLVMDTVRAESVSLHGYRRETTPQLTRWAQRGVKFDWAIAPSCWTFPSHSSFFTGHWPYKLSSHWHHELDTPAPTLAEYLGAKGFQTAGFAANTSYLSYESRINRGFARYEDFVASPLAALGTSAIGRWLVDNALQPADFYRRKWAATRSRDARQINARFLEWLSVSRDPKRPFFAFLNYLDAHGPYLVPETQTARFGLRPQSRREYEMLLESWGIDKTKLTPRDVGLLRDGYDDCIAFLDRQIGALLDELERRDELRNTVVIITSDHGEEFGEHNLFNHGFSLYLYESHVPLVIIAPSAPAGRTVTDAVSLRDLPVSIAALAGLPDRTPFPGHSLADHWREGAVSIAPRGSPAVSEAFFPDFADSRGEIVPTQRGYTMSLVTNGWHYLRDGKGAEALFNLHQDPRESHNLLRTLPDPAAQLSGFRRSVFDVLNDEPVDPATESVEVKRFRQSLERLLQPRLLSGSPTTIEPVLR